MRAVQKEELHDGPHSFSFKYSEHYDSVILRKNTTGCLISLHTLARRGWQLPGLFSTRWSSTSFWYSGRSVVRASVSRWMEWSPTSPPHTPLDSHLWGHLKPTVYQVNIQNINHLKERIANAITEINPDVLRSVLQQWKTRVEMCFRQIGSHIRAYYINKNGLRHKNFIFLRYEHKEILELYRSYHFRYWYRILKLWKEVRMIECSQV